MNLSLPNDYCRLYLLLLNTIVLIFSGSGIDKQIIAPGGDAPEEMLLEEQNDAGKLILNC